MNKHTLQIEEINKYFTQAVELYPKSLEKSLEVIEKISSLLEQVHYPKGVANYFLISGKIFRDLGDIERAKENFTKAKNIYYSLSDNSGILEVLINMGILETAIGFRDQAIETLNLALIVKQKTEKEKEETIELYNRVNELLRIIAHDIKNSSNNISGLAQSLLETGQQLEPDEVKDSLVNIINCSTQIDNIIYDILRSGSIENGNLQPSLKEVNISEIITDTIKLNSNAAQRKSLEIIFYGPMNVIFITDKTFFQQIIDNLLSNAIKFSPQGKRIRIKLEDTVSNVIVKIKDEGPGIKEDEKDKLFHKFTTLSAKPTQGEFSTGLGLSIVKKLADLLNGKVWCESELGKGSEFIIQFNKK